MYGVKSAEAHRCRGSRGHWLCFPSSHTTAPSPWAPRAPGTALRQLTCVPRSILTKHHTETTTALSIFRVRGGLTNLPKITWRRWGTGLEPGQPARAWSLNHVPCGLPAFCRGSGTEDAPPGPGGTGPPSLGWIHIWRGEEGGVSAHRLAGRGLCPAGACPSRRREEGGSRAGPGLRGAGSRPGKHLLEPHLLWPLALGS